MITIMCVDKGQKNATLFLKFKSKIMSNSTFQQTCVSYIAFFVASDWVFVKLYCTMGFFWRGLGAVGVGTNSDLLSCLT